MREVLKPFPRHVFAASLICSRLFDTVFDSRIQVLLFVAVLHVVTVDASDYLPRTFCRPGQHALVCSDFPTVNKG